MLAPVFYSSGKDTPIIISLLLFVNSIAVHIKLLPLSIAEFGLNRFV
jgi:hypothetical protein